MFRIEKLLAGGLLQGLDAYLCEDIKEGLSETCFEDVVDTNVSEECTTVFKTFFFFYSFFMSFLISLCIYLSLCLLCTFLAFLPLQDPIPPPPTTLEPLHHALLP
jgi:hypothetical protein